MCCLDGTGMGLSSQRTLSMMACVVNASSSVHVGCSPQRWRMMLPTVDVDDGEGFCLWCPELYRYVPFHPYFPISTGLEVSLR
jgi:hypothetical protein